MPQPLGAHAFGIILMPFVTGEYAGRNGGFRSIVPRLTSSGKWNGWSRDKNCQSARLRLSDFSENRNPRHPSFHSLVTSRTPGRLRTSTVSIGRDGTVLRQLSTLFNLGTVGGLTDGQLLERFTAGPRGAAEGAFAALIERHGPMVC